MRKYQIPIVSTLNSIYIGQDFNSLQSFDWRTYPRAMAKVEIKGKMGSTEGA